tara:strand:+ start:347 stop:529 length:183 start_codon:yes stop_codon:yes gene_type:complete
MDFIYFGLTQGRRRVLSEVTSEVVAETLLRASLHAPQFSLRTVIRMLDLTERLEAGPVTQ